MPPTAVVVVTLLLAVYIARSFLRRLSNPLGNIPGPSRHSLLTGNLTQYHDPDGWEFQRDLEENYGQVVKIHGVLGGKHLYVFDPMAMQTVLFNENAFDQPPEIMCLGSLLFGKGILSTFREEHRKYRKILMPAFSTANLRGLVPLFYEVAEQARDGLIAPDALQGSQMPDFYSILSRVSLELIGRIGIGYSFDRMISGQKQTGRYAQSLKELFDRTYDLALAFPLLPSILKIPFPSFRRFMIRLIPSATLHKVRDLVDFLDANAAQLVKDRKAAIVKGELGIQENAKDLMSLLMRSNMSTEGDMHLSDQELVAAISMMIFAATDTTSTALAHIIFTLATHPKVQETLRAEILAAPEQLDHDNLTALPYLDAVIHEILRLYPPIAPAMYRQAVEDTVLPLTTPITGVDGTIMHTLNVPKGTPIYLGIAAANHNKQIWGEDALEFKPERWTDGKADSGTTKMCGVYGNTMTFLAGARGCIGLKFSELEIKVVICVLLRAFRFSHPDPRVKWRMAGLFVSPNVDNRPSLPIRTERLHT